VSSWLLTCVPTEARLHTYKLENDKWYGLITLLRWGRFKMISIFSFSCPILSNMASLELQTNGSFSIFGFLLLKYNKRS
jgi:hypothetical protein